MLRAPVDACRLGLEGIVSKRRDAPCRSGRGKDWIEAKCSLRQEFVVAGYVPSTVSGKMIGSLALGYYRAGKLIYAGRVGTGLHAQGRWRPFSTARSDRHRKEPFCAKLPAGEARGVRFVRPELVGEIEFRAWTSEGYVRHASFRGLREDKPAVEVHLEIPKG